MGEAGGVEIELTTGSELSRNLSSGHDSERCFLTFLTGCQMADALGAQDDSEIALSSSGTDRERRSFLVAGGIGALCITDELFNAVARQITRLGWFCG